MRRGKGIVLLCLTALVAIIAIQSVYAEMPTSTPTPTAASTPLPAGRWWLTPTPSSAEGPVATFHAYVWVDAQPEAGDVVLPKIGDQVCGSAARRLVTEGGSYWDVEVVSDSFMPGCGTPGVIITFWVEGRRANETAQWYPGEEERIELVVGAPFALFGGIVNRDINWPEEIMPVINGKDCGYAIHGFVDANVYDVVVYADEFRQGCGVDGTQVKFKLVDVETGEVKAVAREAGTWHAMLSEHLDLTLIEGMGISFGNVGTGKSAQDANDIRDVEVALLLAGAFGLGAGAIVKIKKHRAT